MFLQTGAKYWRIFDFEKNQSYRLKQFENGPTLKGDKNLSVDLEILD